MKKYSPHFMITEPAPQLVRVHLRPDFTKQSQKCAGLG